MSDGGGVLFTVSALVPCARCGSGSVIIGDGLWKTKNLPHCAGCGVARGWLSVPDEYRPARGEGGEA